ncbi:ABC transporter ATP-binding protein [Marinobacter sp. CHS3-4]|uniref:ABC transporter ATP-binding protein n=1 Tax=Marinobacter sp. CHS3-4 TaxID=3045174 RepID=UPI0024B51F68|nr:ABC transporter ATP-binding protein [Marinobacter sp. CHS3-4]MDI9246307.1 ABC transporter ATP-binding protein [Marinobacter sp. CHS3-4]
MYAKHRAQVSVEGLSKRYISGEDRVQVLDNLSFTVPASESLAIVGRSGSGKSTLLNLLCGLEHADTGKVILAGQEFEATQPTEVLRPRWAQLRRQAIGVVFQEANLMPAMTLAENVQLRASLAGQSSGDDIRWLELLGVGAEANRYPDQVSGGQRQRAALAMVFAMKPALILADEPTGSLDLHTADDVADRLFEVQRQTGCTLLLATHDPSLAGRCHHQLNLGGG